jgi:hypothetical protein
VTVTAQSSTESSTESEDEDVLRAGHAGAEWQQRASPFQPKRPTRKTDRGPYIHDGNWAPVRREPRWPTGHRFAFPRLHDNQDDGDGSDHYRGGWSHTRRGRPVGGQASKVTADVSRTTTRTLVEGCGGSGGRLQWPTAVSSNTARATVPAITANPQEDARNLQERASHASQLVWCG